MKTLADFLLALLAFIILIPVMLLVGLLIFLFDFRSPLFIQDRVGRKGIKFKIVKFRTMINGEITFLGRILRKTGIDELPQLWNILRGEMSFVGPRPLTQDDIDRLGWGTSYHKKRWDVKPGIAGLAQLSPVCHKKMSWFLDRYYIEKRNFILDLKILTSSILILFVGKGQMKRWMHNR